MNKPVISQLYVILVLEDYEHGSEYCFWKWRISGRRLDCDFCLLFRVFKSSQRELHFPTEAHERLQTQQELSNGWAYSKGQTGANEGDFPPGGNGQATFQNWALELS